MGSDNDGEPRGIKEVAVQPVTMSSMVARVKARLLYGDVKNDQKALVFEGEAGCGKTSILKQTFAEMGLNPISVTLGAQQVEELLAAGVKVVEDEDGNPKLLQAVHENLIPTDKHVKSGDYTFDVNGKPRTVIPWFFDEIFTGNVAQMNQLRSALTLHQIGSVHVPPEATIIGTTNPQSVEYSSRKSVDAAIMDRCEVVQVKLTHEEHQKYLAKLENDELYPSECRMFLAIEENQDIWGLASPRFWHQGFGNVWHELSEAVKHGGMTDDDRVELFSHAVHGYWVERAAKEKMKRTKSKAKSLTPDALLARFFSYMEKGDDPKFYPLSGVKILNAAEEKDDKLRKKQLGLFAHWKEASQQSFLGVSIQDLGVAIDAVDIDELDDCHVEHIGDLLNMTTPAVCVQFFHSLVRKGYRSMCTALIPQINDELRTALHAASADARLVALDIDGLSKKAS